MITTRSELPQLVATTSSDLAFVVIILLASAVLLVPLIGIVVVVFNIVREMRTERRSANEEAQQ